MAEFEYSRKLQARVRHLPDFRHVTAEPDCERLTNQFWRVVELMSDGMWRTLYDISALCFAPTQSCGSRLRQLRTKKAGSHIVDKRYLGSGLYEYQFLPQGPVYGSELD